MFLTIMLILTLPLTTSIHQDSASTLIPLVRDIVNKEAVFESSAVTTSYSAYLPIIYSSSQGPVQVHDMTTFMIGDRRLYEVWHSSNSQARHQTHGDSSRFYHTKGNENSAEWEELWSTETFIVRGTDTSPGNDQYYIAFDVPGQEGAVWSPRYWSVGQMFERNTYVSFFRKSDCSHVVSGFQQSWLRFVAHYPSYTFGSGITLNNVIELAWLLSPTASPTESYFYAQDYGLVGWESDDRGFSYVSEIHGPGQRPDNNREVIGCLNASLNQTLLTPIAPDKPLPPGYRAK